VRDERLSGATLLAFMGRRCESECARDELGVDVGLLGGELGE